MDGRFRAHTRFRCRCIWITGYKGKTQITSAKRKLQLQNTLQKIRQRPTLNPCAHKPLLAVNTSLPPAIHGFPASASEKCRVTFPAQFGVRADTSALAISRAFLLQRFWRKGNGKAFGRAFHVHKRAKKCDRPERYFC